MSDKTVIDLFCGSGGLSLGAAFAGAKNLIGVDFDRHALDTYRNNFGDDFAIKCDLRGPIGELCDQLPNHDLLIAGPPCQSFSTSNQKTRSDDNPLNNLLFVPVEVAKHTRPKAVVVENVHGLGIGTRKKYLDLLISSLGEIDYEVSVIYVTGTNVALPQNRTRLFVVAVRKPGFRINLENLAQPTVWDAIGDLPGLANGASIDKLPYRTPALSRYASKLRSRRRSCTGHLVTNNAANIVERYKYIPEGGNWKSIPQDLMVDYKDVSRCHTGIYHRLSANLPAKVVGNFRKNMLVHPTQHRGLSIREAARLQSFPDGYEFSGSIGKQQQQVGNAVPPIMAQTIISRVFEHLEANK